MDDIFKIGENDIEPMPQFETPQQLLEHLAPDQDWSTLGPVTWKDARERPCIMELIARVIQIRYKPTIRIRRVENK